MQAIFETAFDAVYLCTVIVLGIIIVKHSKTSRQHLIFGIMAIVLGVGDSFHLVPRAIALCTTGLENFTFSLGVGKLITSITMTIFYVLLYHVWRERYQIIGKRNLTFLVYGLAILRCVICAFPQNGWTSESPSVLWGILRNIPFALLGLLDIFLFFKSANQSNDKLFKTMWLAITLSFLFYIPVVLFSEVYPAAGALMIPKTLAYVWIVLLGFFSMKKAVKKR